MVGVKVLDFLSFCKVVELMHNRMHLTEQGLEQIRSIQSEMNKKRIYAATADSKSNE
jgi:hypothetical protein